MNYYDEIKNNILDNEVYVRVKDYSEERHTDITYFVIGKLLNEAGGKSKDNIIDEFINTIKFSINNINNKNNSIFMIYYYCRKNKEVNYNE